MDRLTAAFEKKFPKEKTELLVKAINFAKSVHADQKRESQEPYYIHPEAVALILLDMDMDADTVIAGLLHDTVEDGHDITVEKIAQMFGKDIARMVDGVTKLTNSNLSHMLSKEDRQAENLRKMFLAIATMFALLLSSLRTDCTTCAHSVIVQRKSVFAKHGKPWMFTPPLRTGSEWVP